MVDAASVAGEVAQVDEAVMKALPFVSGMIGFIPGGAVAIPFMPLVAEFLQVVDSAAKSVAAGNPGAAATDVLQEVMNHLMPGKPNSPILSAQAPSESAQGSG